jgi:signal transduction histidine kinase
VRAVIFTTKPDGTGLGLSICQRIIGAHGGHIRYQTRPGEGTTFVIFLPGRPGG